LAIDDLALAASCFSDAMVLVEAQQKRPWQTPLLPYVASLAGRGVVTHNRHPAPSRFLQTRKPQVFAVDRQALERKRQACRAFLPVCDSSTAISAAAGLGGGFTLVTDTLPYLRLMLAPTVSAPHPLTSEQWDALMELTTFAGRITQSPAAATMISHAALAPQVAALGVRAVAGGASEAEDDIEE